MNTTRLATALLGLMLVATSVAPAVATATDRGIVYDQADAPDEHAYAGAHVTFDTDERAVTNYSVDGETMLESVRTQSRSSAERGADVGIGAEASLVDLADLPGAAVSVEATAETNATVSAGRSATIEAHDTERGVLVVTPGDDEQVVAANVSVEADAQAVDESRVLVERDGSTGVFVLVGDGNVTVTDDGQVVANVSDDAKLTFRAYGEGERDADARATERMIANGTAVAEVAVEEHDGEAVTDTVSYGANTTVEAAQTGATTTEVTVDRAAHEGKVVVVSVSEAAAENADALSVSVDGEAAAEAESYSELRSAIGSETSRYMVRENADANASAAVLVGVNHFSERTITVSDSSTALDGTTDADESSSDGTATDDGADTTDAVDDDTESGGSPGFGVGVALVAIVGGVLAATRLRA
ncbi:PGF-CTERM sorting domain-containing protein [Haloarchaeobius sp. HRN-SO-5]|uniref:PGF-CTERM sorting domain-containing protein n=1 Tax=Haloarchaeobius sp. HRN-SO-5 TaxID=3446118 RepID=UPI003EB6C883